ncbi:MAG: hypothetical protein JXA46_12945 [Dehalococcoidales bacterium]|nr:hypothetical protein [Dehalococcoidales bacterium]
MLQVVAHPVSSFEKGRREMDFPSFFCPHLPGDMKIGWIQTTPYPEIPATLTEKSAALSIRHLIPDP